MAADSDADRAFVLGLDGVPWGMLRRWVEAGELEHFGRLFEEGAAGPMQSTTPATTPVAWPAIATGVTPDEHGIYAFRRLSPEYTHRMYTSGDLGRPPIWDLLSPAVVGNVPMTYPASDVDGAMVSGMMTPERDEGFAHPSTLREEVADAIPDYRIELDWAEYDGSTGAFRDALSEMVAARRELMRLLLDREDWRLFFFVYTAPDRLQHLAWEEEVLLDHYRTLDEIVGEVMDRVAERDATLYVVSDHGFGPVETVVNVNRLLADEGFLRYRDEGGVRGVLSQFDVSKERVLSALARVGLDEETLVDALPRGLVDGVAKQIPGDHVLYDVDYGETAAFVYGPGNLYVNDTERFVDGAVAPGDVPGVKRELRATLSDLTDPATGEQVLRVSDGDELFPSDPRSPDLVVKGREGYEVRTTVADDVLGETGAMSASHRPEGIFLAWGPSIEAGAVPADATVYDVLPTVLHGAGAPVPEHVTGDVLEVFAPDSPPAAAEVTTSAYDGAAAEGDAEAETGDYSEVEDRLRGLGYME
ncbi:MAG: alkaline phosphatase family protein [Haloarculaceae archaeon]